MNAEPLKYAAVYDLIIPDAEHDVFKNFIKRHEQATRFTLIETYMISSYLQPGGHWNLKKCLTICCKVADYVVVKSLIWA